LLLALASETWRFKGRVLAAMALLVVAKLAAVAVPLILKRIVDVLSRPEALAALPVMLLAGYAAVRFSTTLFTELRDVVFARVTQSTVADFSVRTFRHLHELGATFHANRATGALTRDIERGTTAIGYLIGVLFFTIAPTAVEILAVLAVMLVSYAVGFAAIIAVTFAVYAVWTFIMIARRAARQRRVTELDSSAHRRLVDSLLNYETVKVYTNEPFEGRQFAAIMNEWIEAGVGNQRALTALHVGQSAIIGIGVAAVMLLAGSEVLAGRMTVGDLVLVNAYVIQVCLPLNTLGFVLREAADAGVKAEKLFQLLREQPEREPPAPRRLALADAPEVRFERVSFGYEPNRQILWDIDFVIPPGQTLAVVGGSGSGKSTLGRLLLRFFDPWSGRITIGGEDVRRVTREAVRGVVGLVPQDTTLFNDTIAYNIAYGRSGATPEDVVAAAKAANIHDFVNALPEKYETLVGERGLKLSGGEKQRIAIARAMLRDPPVLVLDEATSALDPRAERAIQTALDRLAGPRTTLIIAHRLTTVVGADEIIVLEGGRIVERGRHEQLLLGEGLYAQMWSVQQQERELRRSERRATLQAVNLATIVIDAIDVARPEIDAKGLNLYTTLEFEVGLVTGDPGALYEAVAAVLAQAVHVSDYGARLEVAIAREGNRVTLRVTDTHESHPPEGAAAAKPPETTRSPRFDPIALRALLEEHQGSFALEPATPAGTSYVLSLPVRAVAVPSAVAPPVAQVPAAVPLAGRSLVIVDDDEDARESLRLLLELQHAEVVTFPSGRAALAYLQGRSRADWPDLVICDIGLPEEDGYAVLRRVRALEAEHHIPLARRMPAIALTGYAQPEDRMRTLLAGFQVHLTKPALPQELIATIGRLLAPR
jgi:ATP-binding cassette subfamily B protein